MLDPDFTRDRRQGRPELTEEEQAKRQQRSRAQKAVAHYFRHMFWFAFKADWGLNGKKKPKERTSKEKDLLLPSNSWWCVYVLGLEDGCYYIGKTRDLQRRTLEHFVSASAGAEWTREHKPRRVLEVLDVPEVCLPAGLFEDLVTKQYMMRFGIRFIRGGSYAGKVITEDTLFGLRREFAHAEDKCFCCGAADHFSRDCSDRPGGAASTGGTRDAESVGTCTIVTVVGAAAEGAVVLMSPQGTQPRRRRT